MQYQPHHRASTSKLNSVVVLLFLGSLVFVSQSAAEPTRDGFEFPTSENGASFHFTSLPDLFNWNIGYPQPGWEEAMDWFLGGMKKEGPAFSLNAGDIMDARWWSDPE
jgi:hypothetical protein